NPNGANNTAQAAVFDARNAAITTLPTNATGTWNGPNHLQLNGYNNNTSESSDCDIAEVLIYPGVMPAAAKSQTEQYLVAKYFGVALGGPIPGIGKLPPTTAVTVTNGGVLDAGADQTVASINGDATAALVLTSGTFTTGSGNTADAFPGT